MIDDPDLDPREWAPISACAGHFPALYESHPMPKPTGCPVPDHSMGPHFAAKVPFHLSDGRGRSLRVGSRIGSWRVSGVVRGHPVATVFAECVTCGAKAEAAESVLRAGCRHGAP